MKSRNRIQYIDLAKGIGILAVLWGHILLSGWSYVLVYAFDIPMFFFLSGMVYNPSKYERFKDFIKSRIKSLLIPYLFFSIATWVIWVGHNLVLKLPVDNYWYPLFQTFIAQGSGGFLIHNVPLWFVTCLFVVEVMYYFISKFSELMNLTICLLFAFIGYVFVYIGWTKLPWNIEAAFSVIIFYAAGHLCVDHYGKLCFPEFCNRHKKSVWFMLAVFSVLFICGALWNGHITFGSNCLGKSVYTTYCVAFMGIVIVLTICAMLSINVHNWCTYLCWIGEHSFCFMAMHFPVKRFIAAIVSKIFGVSGEEISRSVPYSFIVFLISLAVTSLAVKILIMLKCSLDQHIYMRANKDKCAANGL